MLRGLKYFRILSTLLLTLIFGVSEAQSYIKIFRNKDSKAPGAEFVVRFNGREIASLKNGQRLEYQLFSTGTVMVDISSPHIPKESQNAIQIEIYAGETYYVETGINEYLELYFKEVNMYQGKAKFNDPKNFRKTEALIVMKEDAFDPIIAKAAQNRELLTPEDYQAMAGGDEDVEIMITEPDISGDKVHEFFGEVLIVKGRITHPDQVSEISVNGNKATVIGEDNFEVSVPFDQFLENDVSVKVFTKSGKFHSKDFKVKRVLSEYDMAKRERQGKDYALILANSEYDEFSSLVNPTFDADRIAKELEENYGFIVEKHYNNTQKDIYLTLKEFTKKAFHPDDQLLIFFAGHGDFDYLFSEGYVVCKDSKKDDEARSSFISHSNLRTIINNIPCQHIFLVMDVCFGGTFDPVVAARGDEYTETDREKYIKRKMQYKTRLYLTSGGKEYVPDGRPGMHSPFAKNFIQALLSRGGSDGILTYGEILQHIDKTTPEPQFGEFGDNALGSDFLFIVK